MRRCLIAGCLVSTLAVTAGQTACSRESRPTVNEAQVFIDQGEAKLFELWKKVGQVNWVQNTYITDDTKAMATAANKELMAATTKLALQASDFNTLNLPVDLSRKLLLLKTSLSAVASSEPMLQQELAEIMTEMESLYSQGEYCQEGEEECLALPTMERMLAEVRDTDELLDLWQGWRRVSPQIRPLYERFIELSNAGAQELGFADVGDMWRSGYDMPSDDLIAELERLWEQVRPLYESLHCYVRAELGREFGTAVVPQEQPIPAHLLGNMWSQTWGNVYNQIKPRNSRPVYDLTTLLRRKRMDELEMVRYGESFFTSLGFEPLPPTFWERSLFVRPSDHDVVCHASAWNLDLEDDVRIKMCISVTGEDFVTIHHELGHNYYQRAYNIQDPLYRTGANGGFHEGIGDTIALSITPEYLVKVGLLKRVPSTDNDISLLLRQALDKIAFLPFGLLVDQWRWKVFSGEITPDGYNKRWWDLRRQYQGIRPPVARNESDFDPGAKYHVPANVPYTRYFLAHILQFQFHRSLCEVARITEPLHRCSIFDNKDAGRRLKAMLQMGASRPWADALEAITGARQLDATAIFEYFAPLSTWLDEQNKERSCGWS